MKFLEQLKLKSEQQFKQDQMVLSFEDYLKRVSLMARCELRGSAQYAVDFLKTLDPSWSNLEPKVIGQERVKEQIHHVFHSFARLGHNPRLVLLHGPNGSAKSSLIQAFFSGLEQYSRTSDGALYTFSWVFPNERSIKGGLGIRPNDETQKSAQKHNTYAYLKDEDIACVLPSETRDSPFLLIPKDQRLDFLKSIDFLMMTPDFRLSKRLEEGNLSQRDHLIFEALLKNYHGDIEQVFRHIRVERFYLSKTYRSGLVTIEPQMHVDAQVQQISINRSLQQLPASLSGLNLFALSGDLPESNRGAIDYNDLLKRPLDSFKYLLTACEGHRVGVGPVLFEFDLLFLGSSNELQLDAFKEYPDFGSFKGRLDFIQVPYLLKYSEEQKIYEPILEEIAGKKPVSPHTAWAISFWGVLTRLKKPIRDHFGPEFGAIVDSLSPVEKAKLYDHDEIPERLNQEERKVLKAHLEALKNEYRNVPYYEGRSGASARELREILLDAAQSSDFKTLSPLSIASELRKFVKRKSEYDFLRVDSVGGYHEPEAFIESMLKEYAHIVDREVRESLGLYETAQWDLFMKRYITHLSAYLKKERIKNPITGGYEEADQTLLNEFETIVAAPSDPTARETFRQNLMTRIGAWVLDHPKEPMDYVRIFPELRTKLEKHFYETQRALLEKMRNALKMFGTDVEDPSSEGNKLARQTLDAMQKKFGYSLEGAKEVIGFLMQ